MAASKVSLNGTTIIDISDTTAQAGDVASGKVFYMANGVQATGTSTPGVTGVKGNAENNYRTGDVNLTPANVGAKSTQSAVGDPTASGNATAFIATISQDVQGVITVTKKNVPSASQSAAGLMSAADKTKLDGIASGAQVNSVTGVKGNAESSYRTGNVNLTPANIGAVESIATNAARTRIYNGVASLGLTSGSATIIAAFNALPDGGILYAIAQQFSSSEVPNTTGLVEINRVTEGSRAAVHFYGKQKSNGDYRMYLGASAYNGQNDNAPTGTWTLIYDESTTVPVGHGGTGATTADAARQNLLALKTTALEAINPDTIKHNFIGTTWSITGQPSDIGNCGTLIVTAIVPFADTGTRVRQVFHNFFAESIWTRKWDGSTWSSWKCLVNDAGAVPVDAGGTGATTAVAARTNLGIRWAKVTGTTNAAGVVGLGLNKGQYMVVSVYSLVASGSSHICTPFAASGATNWSALVEGVNHSAYTNTSVTLYVAYIDFGSIS